MHHSAVQTPLGRLRFQQAFIALEESGGKYLFCQCTGCGLAPELLDWLASAARPANREPDTVALTVTRLRFWVTSAVFSKSFSPRLAAFSLSGAVNPRARVTSVASAAAWL